MENDPNMNIETSVRVMAQPDMGPLSVELTLEPHVYLHHAELVQDFKVHARSLPRAYKDESTAVWRQVGESTPDKGLIEFGVSWLAIANATPGVSYEALLTIRDARGLLLKPCGGSQNPACAPGQIGPAEIPTDTGRFGVAIIQSKFHE